MNLLSNAVCIFPCVIAAEKCSTFLSINLVRQTVTERKKHFSAAFRKGCAANIFTIVLDVN